MTRGGQEGQAPGLHNRPLAPHEASQHRSVNQNLLCYNTYRFFELTPIPRELADLKPQVAMIAICWSKA